MSKISDLPDGGSLSSTDYLVAVRAGGNVKVQADGAVSGTTGTFSGDFNVDSGTFFVDASANAVGIGTTIPADLLHVKSSTAAVGDYQIVTEGTVGGYGAGVSFQSQLTGGSLAEMARITADGEAAWDTTAANQDAGLRFYTSLDGTVAEKMRIDASGNLLVGTTSSSGAGTAGVGIANRLAAGYQGALNGFGNEDYSGFFYSGGASNGFTAINSNSGNVPLYISLSSSATTGTLINFSDTGSNVGTISTNGTTTSYNTSSDARLKENIADAEDASSLVDAIKVRQFDWKANGSHQRYGMVAQELLEVAPEAVSQPEDPEAMMGVDYSKLVPMLVKEIQSLRARVAQLEQP